MAGSSPILRRPWLADSASMDTLLIRWGRASDPSQRGSGRETWVLRLFSKSPSAHERGSSPHVIQGWAGDPTHSSVADFLEVR
jgi:hypothetical protein